MAKVYFCVGSYYQPPSLKELRTHLRSHWMEIDDYVILTNEQCGSARPARGFATIYNPLVSLAFSDPNCKLTWILGDDVLPVEHCIRDTTAAIEGDETIGAIFPVEAWLVDNKYLTMLSPAGKIVPIEEAISTTPYEQLFAGFACACIRREAWHRVGPMDEDIGRGYGEDLDWGIRCWKAGFRVVNWRAHWFKHIRGATYNKLIEDGLYRKEEPYEAADMVKKKWPWLWNGEPFKETMARLHAWYKETRP